MDAKSVRGASSTNASPSEAPSLIVPRLYLGNYDNAASEPQLFALGVTHVVNCTDNLPHEFEESSGVTKIKYFRVGVRDLDSEDISLFFHSAVRFIHEAMQQDSAVILVHCMAGAIPKRKCCASFSHGH